MHTCWMERRSYWCDENTVKIKKINKKSKILASVGPCISKMSYEVDLVFYKKFILKSKSNSMYFSKKNKNKNTLI